jgi:hypothetical protein
MAEAFDLTGVTAAAIELQEFCQTRNWKFCFIGGMAVQAWALPRATVDADITLLTGFGAEQAYVEELLTHFQPRYADSGTFALRHRVLLLWSANRCGLDIGLGALPFEENSIRRSVVCEIAKGCFLRVCCAEDLIVHKAFAARDQDWADVDTILMRQGRRLDTALIFRELEPLVALKEEPAILGKLRTLMRRRLVL